MSKIRPATPDDAPHLVRWVSMAGEGVPEIIWADMAGPGQSTEDVGLARARREEGSFSYRNAWVLEQDGRALGSVVGYPLPNEPVEIGPDFPPPFVPLQELENQAPGYWYVNILAVDPDMRGQGLGNLLLDHAEYVAHKIGCRGMAIIAMACNPGAVRLYTRRGYVEQMRRRIALDGWEQGETDAILLLKPF